MHFVATGDYKINCGMTNMGKKTFETQKQKKNTYKAQRKGFIDIEKKYEGGQERAGSF